MKQAKVLTAAEMKRLLAVIADERYAERNRLAVMLSHFAGLRVGEIASLIIEGDDIYGDGVNIAARLQELAEPGSICISGTVFDQVDGNRKPFAFTPVDERRNPFTR